MGVKHAGEEGQGHLRGLGPEAVAVARELAKEESLQAVTLLDI